MLKLLPLPGAVHNLELEQTPKITSVLYDSIWLYI